MRKFSFQASGKEFQATRFIGENVLAFDAGQVATFGGYKGQVAPHGAALFLDVEHKSEEGESLLKFCQHLTAIQPDLRNAGATRFILHFERVFLGDCNEELTRRELYEIARLDCSLFYTAKAATAPTTSP